MAEPFIGEIRIMSFNFAPSGWAMCNGQLLPINQNQPLFSLLGTRYGGNGQTNFALPDLRGKVPIHQGNGHTIAETAGSQSVTVNISQLPTHTHFVNATNTVADQQGIVDANNVGNMLAQATADMYGAPNAPLTTLNPAMISSVGGSQPHENMQPYLVLTFCIALIGIFPSQT